MTPRARKATLAVHLTVSVSWIGAAAAYLVLGVSARTSNDVQTIRSAWIAMDLIGSDIIVPLGMASFVTGVIIAIGTRWGLFRHYWVVFSLGLTLFANVILALHMPAVSSKADRARTADPSQLQALGGDVLHPGVGIVLLVLILLLNMYKPRGLTPYRLRKQ